MDRRTLMSYRFGRDFLLIFGGLAVALTVLGCSSDETAPSGPGGDAGPSTSSGGQNVSGAGGGTSSGGGGTSGAAGMAGSGGGGSGAGGAAGSGGASGSCASSADCSAPADCCVTMSIDQGAIDSSSAECGAPCEIRAGSTGTGSIIHSVACVAKADCAGVANEFGVPYSQCCTMPNSTLGVCVSETEASFTFQDAGGSCK